MRRVGESSGARYLAVAAGREGEARPLADAAAGPLRSAGFRREIARADALLGRTGG